MSNLLREQLQTSLGAAYTLERELGGGGMSCVFVARDLRLERSVVVKALSPELAADISAERFTREIKLAAALQEPHIVPVISDGVTANGIPYYLMPFVRGASLRQRMINGPVPITEAVSILRDVAKALAYAHRANVVHRDIKPENILLSEGTAVVVDFGIAKALMAATHDGAGRTSGLTSAGVAIGTPAYMAPEQAAGDEVDHRADLYAWGVIAYELLGGEHPFAGKVTAQRLVAAHLGETPRPLSVRRPDLPPALVALVMRCLEKDPDRRPQRAEALLASLNEADMAARPRSWRLAAAAVLALVIAVVAVLVARGRGSESPRAAVAARADASADADSLRYASSLAVLPLANYSRDPAQEYFVDGMTDELTATLSKLQALRVIAHRSMLQFKRSSQSVPEIARTLGVKYVVDGSVLQEGNRIRIRATLLDAGTNAPIWTESFERERRDVVALQREVALAIAREIEITLTPQDRARLADTLPVDPVAFDLYIKGTQARYRALGDAENSEAARYLERAIARDPDYAPAYGGLASLQALMGDGAGARRSAERARALDPTLAEAPMVLGMVRQLFDRDWDGAEAAFREAIRLNPGHAEAHHELSMHLMRLGRFDEARREGLRTLYLAPLTPRFELGLGEIYFFAGRYDEAIAAAKKALALDSTYIAPHLFLAVAYALQGKFDEAENAVRKCTQPACAEEARPILGYVYALAGKRAEAQRIVEDLEAKWRSRTEGPGDVVSIAGIHAGLGERTKALEWLERGVEVRAFMAYVGIDPVLQRLRDEPRFRAVLKAIGLPAGSTANQQR